MSGFPYLARTEWWRTNRTSPLSIPSPNAGGGIILARYPFKVPTTSLTDCCAHHFYGTFSPIFVKHLFLCRPNICVIRARLDLLPASLRQSFSNFFRLLFSSFRNDPGTQKERKADLFCGAIYNAALVRVILKDVVYHHIQMVTFFLRFWKYFVVKVFPIQRG